MIEQLKPRESGLRGMKPNNIIIDYLLNVIAHVPGARVEDVAKLTPELTLREVFDALCYLSRTGQLRLIVDGQGGFAVTTALRSFN
jgi:hypothetical protein